MADQNNFFKNTDAVLLVKQMNHFYEIVNDENSSLTPEQHESVEGILNMLGELRDIIDPVA